MVKQRLLCEDTSSNRDEYIDYLDKLCRQIQNLYDDPDSCKDVVDRYPQFISELNPILEKLSGEMDATINHAQKTSSSFI